MSLSAAQVANPFLCRLGGSAMWRTLRLVVGLLAVQQAPGWWGEAKRDVPRPPAFSTEPRAYMRWVYNQTVNGTWLPEDFWDLTPKSWDGWLWMACDAIFSTLGWLIFGRSWDQVRGGFSVIIRLSVLLFVCVIIHYLLALCWPVISLLMGIALTLVWLVRTTLKCCGRVMFVTQRLTGGVPEAVDASFFGPELGEVPETSELRKLKRSGEGERWVLLRREGRTVIFKVQETSSIKASGLYVTIEPNTMRGDQDLLASLQGYDKVHICRHESCNEEGPHFKQYAVGKVFNAEGFQLAAASDQAKRASYQIWGWFRTGAGRAVQKARDLASESETEEVRCLAGRIHWEDEHGHQRLCNEVCTASGSVESQLLEEDLPAGLARCILCPKHATKYLQGRFQLKCVVANCTRVGLSEGTSGLRLCTAHAEVHRPTSSRRSLRSRSRVRERGDYDPEDEDHGGGGLRRRVRHDSGQVRGEEHVAEQMVEEMRTMGETPEPRTRRASMSDASPGRTPRSAVQRNLAKLGMINSPDRREMLSTLEEFLAQLLEAKEMGIDEEDLRSQMAASAGVNLRDFTKTLYDQAVEEQRKGTKGLTKFLAKWRKQLAAEPTPTSSASWSLVGSPGEEQSVSTPDMQKAAKGEPTLVKLGPPGIYGVDDRKAGTGGPPNDHAMLDLAKAIQNQTTELASLVKSQNDTAANATAGTMRSLGKQSEELVFLLRAYGQYTVEVGANEYGTGLAQALLTAQAGASTRLRNAGFR